MVIFLLIIFVVSVFAIISTAQNKVNDLTYSEFLSELGIVKGYEDGLLHPEYNQREKQKEPAFLGLIT